jgi:hemin uptake protein HemP
LLCCVRAFFARGYVLICRYDDYYSQQMQSRNDNSNTQAGIAEAAAGSNSANAMTGVPPDAPVVEAATLFGSHRQVVIGHNGCRYVLRITRHGKLILNK